MTTNKVRSAKEVIDSFLEEKSQDEALDAATVSAIRDLRSQAKLTKTSLLRRLEAERKTALRASQGVVEEDGDDEA